MSRAYVLEDGGQSKPMERVRCKNEDKELQLILARNPGLLPGDQINPEDPRRWLMIEREMPVPDPATGGNRWNIDLLFADQSAIPTFIECKRFEDTRARREVIGQMIEYAANGQYYWEEAELAERAAKWAEQDGSDLDHAVTLLDPEDGLSVGEYFERMQMNLREGQLRLVFFLEEAPMELKSIVDFLNRQMERSEVLLVEAQQFREGPITVVYPRLFGYTEEARKVKKTRTVSVGPRKTWDESSFRQAVTDNLDQESATRVFDIYSFFAELAPERRWGSAINGSANFYWTSICNGAIFSVSGNGDLTFGLGSMQGNAAIESFRDKLYDALTSEFGFSVKEDYEKRYPTFKVVEWGVQVEKLKLAISNIVSELLANTDE